MPQTTYEKEFTLQAWLRLGGEPVVLSGTLAGDNTILKAEFKELSLEKIINDLIQLVRPTYTLELPYPWDQILGFEFRDLVLSYNIKNKSIGFESKFELEVPPKVPLLELKRVYIDAKSVHDVRISFDGSILGETYEGDNKLGWNLVGADGPPTAPPPPSLFDLKFLGLGQRMRLTHAARYEHVSDAINDMASLFDPPEKGTLVPRFPDALAFDNNSNWLFGLDAEVMGTVALSIVFNDPNLYGLFISLKGEKAKSLAGLEFEILYKKITDDIGVYQIELKLPAYIRSMEFGAVSVTLPQIGVDIYTNGNFKIDFGFPRNLVFTNSFAVQVFPFVGFGGFYFAVLNGATSSTLPVTQNGSFNPVLEFGIGLQLGVGKSIDKGILQASATLTFVGVVEGTLAWFDADEGIDRTLPDFYYRLNGTFAIVGKIWGGVHFAIVSASLDLTVYASATVVIEAVEPIRLSFSAGVSVSLRVSVDLGLFTIHIRLSFHTTISYQFLIGSSSNAQWKARPALPHSPAGLLEHTAVLEPLTDREKDVLIEMDWDAAFTEEKAEQVDLYYFTQFSIADETGSAKDPADDNIVPQVVGIGMLFAPSNDKTARDETLTTLHSIRKDLYTFEQIAVASFCWALNAASSKEQQATSLDSLLAGSVTQVKLANILYSLTRSNHSVPFSYAQIIALVKSLFILNIRNDPNFAEGTRKEDRSLNLSLFPMIPDLFYQPQNRQERHFSSFHRVGKEYLETVEQMVNRYSMNQQGADAITPESEPESLSTLLFRDYFQLLIKMLVQSALDAMQQYKFTIPAEIDDDGALPTLFRITRRFTTQDVSSEDVSAIAISNQNNTLLLNPGAKLTVSGINYSVVKDDSLARILRQYGLLEDGQEISENLLQQLIDLNGNSEILTSGQTITFKEFEHQLVEGDTLNTLLEALNPDAQERTEIINSLKDRGELLQVFKQFRVPVIEHTIRENETLLGISNLYQVDLKALALENQHNESILRVSQKIIIENLRKLNIGELISYLNHDGALQHAAGTASRFFLYGLRLPNNDALDNSSPGETGSLYHLSGQQFRFDFSVDEESKALISGQVVLSKVSGSSILQQNYPDPLTWVAFNGHTVDPVSKQLARLEHEFLRAEVEIANEYRKAIFSPTIEQGPLSIKLYNDQLKTYTLGNPISWQTETKTSATESSSIWMFPPGLRSIRDQSPKMHLVVGTQPQKNTMMQKENVSKDKYNWSSLLPITVRKLDQDSSANEINNNTYEVYGSDAAGIEMLTDLVSRTNVIDNTGILFQSEPDRNEANALQSYDESGLTLLINTNLSTETNPDTLIPNADNDTAGIPSTSAHDMVIRLWKASLVRTGGYYLYLRNEEGKGIPDNLFANGQTTDIYLLINYKKTDEIQGYMNAVSLRHNVNSEHSVLFAEWQVPQDDQGNIVNPDLLVEEQKIARIPAILPGNAGFKLLRKNPNRIYGVTEDNKAATDPYRYQLETQYNLLDFEIIDNDYFENKGEGLAVGPEKDHKGEDLTAPSTNDVQSTDMTDPWKYKRAIPLKKIIKNELPHETAYLGLDKTLQMEFCWRDNYGNRLQHNSENGLKLGLHIKYFDYLVPLSQWPHTRIDYEFTADKSAGHNFEINFLFHAADEYSIASDGKDDEDIQAEVNALKDRVHADLNIFKKSLDQIQQQDVDLFFNVSITPDLVTGYPKADHALLKSALADYLAKIIFELDRFLQQLADGVAESMPKIADVAYSWRENVTDTNGNNIFPLVVEFSIQRDEGLIDPAFRHVPQVQWVKTQIKTRSENLPVLISKNEAEYSSFIDELNELRLPDFIAQRFKLANAKLTVTEKNRTWQVKTPQKTCVIQYENDGLYFHDSLIGLGQLAESFENLYPGTKVTAAYTKGKQQQEVWIVRFKSAENKTGIDFNIHYDQALFYAPQPLSTHLASLSQVPILAHTDYGVVPAAQPLAMKNYSMVDPETWAMDYLETLETTLSPEFSIAITMFDNLLNSGDNKGFLYTILQAKRKVAHAIALQTIPILEDSRMQTGGLGVAREKLKQQLLINLVDGYKTNAVVQYNVDVVSQYPDEHDPLVQIAPNLFGQPVAAGKDKIDVSDSEAGDMPNYSLSSAKLALTGNRDDAELSANSYLTFLFNTQTERYHSQIPLDIEYSINHLEFDIRTVEDKVDYLDPDSISHYSVSKWLSFVRPFTPKTGDTATTAIPVPLRRYPRLANLSAQQFTTRGDSQDVMSIPKAKQIDYSFSYRLPQFTAQDTFHFEVLFNSLRVDEESHARIAKPSDELDRLLQQSLAQFNEARNPVLNDLRRLLPLVKVGMEAETEKQLKRVLFSYDQLVNRVADAWFDRFDPEKLRAMSDDRPKVIRAKFDLDEDEDRENIVSGHPSGPGLFRISMTNYSIKSENQAVGFIAAPMVQLDGYEVEAHGYLKNSGQLEAVTNENRYDEWEKIIFHYYRIDKQQQKVYLPFEEGQQILNRRIAFSDLDVLLVQNAWAGFNVVRNAKLSGNKPTSEEFIYTTAMKRFANPVTPMLDITHAIDLADAGNSDAIELAQFLRSMVSKLLESNVASLVSSAPMFQPTTLKIVTSYSFTSNPDVGAILQPCFLIPPMLFDKRDTTAGGAGITLLKDGIIDWFSNNTPVQSEGKLYFDITFYSLLTDNDLPVLRLRQLFIDVEKITTLKQYAGS